MKNKFFLVVVMLLCHSLMASEITMFTEEFKQHRIQCKTEKKPSTTLNCHQQSVLNLMLEHPAKRELILIAVLKASPDRITETVKAAIDFGMAPMVVITRAIETVPEHSEKIGQGAMSAGVDSIVVTEATTTILNLQ